MTQRALSFLPFIVVSFLAGCVVSHDDADGSVVADGGVPDSATGRCTSLFKAPAPDKVDLLLVVDDSPSMVEEQASLAAQLPRLVSVLTTGDRDGDGVRDFVPVHDLHAGAITVNMGVGGIPDVPTCMRNADFGDDGVLLTTPRVGGAGCAASYPPFLQFTSGTTDPAQFATDLTCLARTGTSGCGFEQQLDATLKALVPSTAPITFAEGTHGHGDELDVGFLRPDSLVVVVLVTDEDDCSTSNTDIWDSASTTHVGDLNLRCINYASELYPISRFVDGLRSLRPDDPSRVVFAAITGVPEDLVGATTDYDALFADPRMSNTITTTDGTSTLAPACSSPGRGSAMPAIRIAQVARAFGPNGMVQSICSADFGPAIDAVIHRVSIALDADCLPGTLVRDASGTLPCTVEESFVPSAARATCDGIPGATASRVDADGVMHCTVHQTGVDAATRASGRAPAEDAPGWYYDDYSDATHVECSTAGSRLRFFADAMPPSDVATTVSCEDAACGS